MKNKNIALLYNCLIGEGRKEALAVARHANEDELVVRTYMEVFRLYYRYCVRDSFDLTQYNHCNIKICRCQTDSILVQTEDSECERFGMYEISTLVLLHHKELLESELKTLVRYITYVPFKNKAMHTLYNDLVSLGRDAMLGFVVAYYTRTDTYLKILHKQLVEITKVEILNNELLIDIYGKSYAFSVQHDKVINMYTSSDYESFIIITTSGYKHTSMMVGLQGRVLTYGKCKQLSDTKSLRRRILLNRDECIVKQFMGDSQVYTWLEV